MTTIEGNKLIAEFMGAIIAPLPFGPDYMRMTGDKPFSSLMWTCSLSELEYHSSWDWLMPVVEKIGEMDEVYHYELSPNAFSISAEKDFENIGAGINKVHKTVVQFIQWYNQQTQQP